AGLIRPWEIRQGHINHALAFACKGPSGLYVFPATRSDGQGGLRSFPEGARLQLDPGLTDRDFERWGLSAAGKVIARALQEYGMILVDGGGHPKIYVEGEHTASWNGLVEADTVKPIPYSAFRLLCLTAPAAPPAPRSLQAHVEGGVIVLQWEASDTATRYRVKRREAGEHQWVTLDPWVTQTRYADRDARPGVPYEYSVHGVSHNGVSDGAVVQVAVERQDSS
ncbi:MAG: fibronectin type III domain-containing protein, partial [Planctomycetes bacterium]|nr:fibronectin type III domain-containing protein [Planctomycetota bacterium]